MTKRKAGSGCTWETAPGTDFHDKFEERVGSLVRGSSQRNCEKRLPKCLPFYEFYCNPIFIPAGMAQERE